MHIYEFTERIDGNDKVGKRAATAEARRDESHSSLAAPVSRARTNYKFQSK